MLLLTNALSRLSLRPALSAASSAPSTSASAHALRPAARSLHSTPAALATWGAKKPKSHGGTTKRFRAAGFQRASPRLHFTPHAYAWDSYTPEALAQASPEHVQALLQGGTWSHVRRKIGPMFKRGRPGKQHINVGMHGAKRRRLRGTAVESKGPTLKVLRRLMGPAL